MENQSKKNVPIDNQTKYGNKVPFNNVPPAADEELAPILVTSGVRTDPALDQNNIETWKIHGHKIPVAFAPVKRNAMNNWMKFFQSQVRTYIATGGTDEFLKEHGHEDDLSYTKFMDDAESDDDAAGFEPGQTKSLEDTVLMSFVVDDLINAVSERNNKAGRIIQLLYDQKTRGEIIKLMGLGKSQGYEDIRKAIELARDIYLNN